MTRLTWKSHLRPHVVDCNNLVVLSETGHHFFEGGAYVVIAELLQRQCKTDEIRDALAQRGVSAFESELALSHLGLLGLVTSPPEVPADLELGEVAYWHSLGIDIARLHESFSQAPVALLALTPVDTGPLRAALARARIPLVDDPTDANILVVVTEDYGDTRLERINEARLADGRPWIMLKLVGSLLWIGPFFRPGATACWGCLQQRLRLNRQTELVVSERLGRPIRAPMPFASWSVDIASQVAALTMLDWIAHLNHTAAGAVIHTYDLETHGYGQHRLIKRPQCRACGAGRGPRAIEPEAAPIELRSSLKLDRHRLRGRSVEETLENLQHHVSPITGVVRSVEAVREGGNFHVSASQYFPMYRYDFAVLRENLVGRSGGKGLTRTEAHVAALCEALERYSGIWQGEEERVVNMSVADLKDRRRTDFVDLHACLGFSVRQYRKRESWNARNQDPHHWIPAPLPDELAIDWVHAISLLDGRPRLVPAAYCYFGHPDLRHGFCGADSNGCAAGNSFTEALAFGMLELIERDAAAIWWFNRLWQPAIDLDKFALSLVEDLRRKYESERRTFWAIDLTTDLEIPVIAAISAKLDDRPQDIIYGFGAGFDPQSALRRALLEMDQSYYAVAAAGADKGEGYRTHRPAALHWFKNARLDEEQHLLPDRVQRSLGPTDYRSAKTGDWLDDVRSCASRLGDAGFDPLVVDLTRADIALPVCRVIVPGLCHIWRRFGHQRLCDMPVRAGRLSRRRAEAELNRWPIYF
jgi:bacteriocin biosynthesis cyclodehydratase domain-containing protein